MQNSNIIIPIEKMSDLFIISVDISSSLVSSKIYEMSSGDKKLNLFP